MSVPTLPETLVRLAGLLPERVQTENNDRIVVRWGVESDRSGDDFGGAPRWRYLWARWGAGWVPFREMSEQWVEAALREECAERDWGWQVEQRTESVDGSAVCRATISRPNGFCVARASSPVHALALALISAVGGEGL